MVRFDVECPVPFPASDFWRIRDTPSFLNFIVADGLLKHIAASTPTLHPDGWQTRQQHYCPANVDCPDIVRAVVGDTLFEITDYHRWHETLNPRHLSFVIRPSFLTALSNTQGSLSVNPFPPDRQAILPPPSPPSPSPPSPSQSPTPSDDVIPAQPPSLQIPPSPASSAADSDAPSCVDTSPDVSNDTLTLHPTPTQCLQADSIPDGARTPNSVCSSLDEDQLDILLLDDSPFLPEIYPKHSTNPPPSIPTPSSPTPASKTPPTDTTTPPSPQTITQHNTHTDDIGSEIDSSSAGADTSDNDTEPHSSSPSSDDEAPVMDEKAKAKAKEHANALADAAIERLPPSEKAILHIVGTTRVRILTLGWFVERAIVHNLRQFYKQYPGTVYRFRQSIYRQFANGDESVPISVVVDRVVQWDRENERREKELEEQRRRKEEEEQKQLEEMSGEESSIELSLPVGGR